MWYQREFSLEPKARGFHLVTEEILVSLPEISELEVGLLHLFLQHTSASLTINENADADVRVDMETYFNRIAPESGLPIRHTIEGSDDMPAHVKASLLGCGLTVPIRHGNLALGTWQGIYLAEHRNRAGRRYLVATIFGQ
jgi:secondary thiamine-phosphate synthase enzyme